MRKINKMLMVVAIASITVLSSCIKNEVAPEVTALRQAQLNMINAKIEMQTLLNEQQRIENLIDQSNADLQIVLDDLEEQRATADLQQQLAIINYNVTRYQALLQQQELVLQTAIDNLADYLASQGLNDAANFLSQYGSQMLSYTNTLSSIYSQEAFIAGLQASLAQADYALAAEIIQRDLDDQMADLAAMETALTSLEGVAENPAIAEAEKAALEEQIAGLIEANLLLDVDIAKLTNKKDSATAAVTNADDIIATMEGGNHSVDGLLNGLTNDETSKQDEITVKQDAITAKETEIADKTTDITAANAVLSNLNSVLSAFQVALAPYSSALTLAETAEASALSALNIAEANLTVAQNNLTADDGSDPAVTAALTTAVVDATTVRDDAQTVYGDAQTATAAALVNYNLANGDVTTAQTDVDNQQIIVDGLNGDLDTLNGDLDTLNDDLNTLNGELASIQADIAALQVDYDAAVANLTALMAAETVAIDALDVPTAAKAANTALKNQLQLVVNAIDAFLTSGTSLVAEIESLKDDIETKKIAINATEKSLADDVVDEAELTSQIAAEQQELVRLQGLRDGYLALANEYFALYTAAIGG